MLDRNQPYAMPLRRRPAPPVQLRLIRTAEQYRQIRAERYRRAAISLACFAAMLAGIVVTWAVLKP